MQPLLARNNLGIFKFSPWTLIFFLVHSSEVNSFTPTMDMLRITEINVRNPAQYVKTLKFWHYSLCVCMCIVCMCVYACACVHVCWWEETSTCHMLEIYSILNSHLSPEIVLFWRVSSSPYAPQASKETPFREQSGEGWHYGSTR